ncbi:MAG: lipase maturation factor family protein, partial [Planctomycetota bacterium]
MIERLRRLLRGADAGPSTYRISRALFLRLLGVVHLIAFVSLWGQIEGLVGSGGIVPVAEYLDLIRGEADASVARQFPTLCWISDSDAFLHAQCAAGVILAGLLVIGIAPLPVLGALWLVYLSLVIAGQQFMSFQWDTLLLETTFVAMFAAPASRRLRIATARPPTRGGLLLVRLLLFKLMFLSGVTKLLSGDPTWRDGTAMTFHYETQPIPAATSWYAHQLPAWMHGLSGILMFVVELGVPFLLFGPRRVRHAAAAMLIALQLGIMATGNYGFFNVLTIVLCVPVLDDRLLRRCLLPSRREAFDELDPEPAPLTLWAAPRIFATWIAALLSVFAFAGEMVGTRRPDRLPRWTNATLDVVDALVVSWTEPHVMGPLSRFRTFNGYGLFRVMTVERPEIVIEARRAGESWQPLAFHWKPGDPKDSPRFVAPHMPRLDWQMWFAALNPRGQTRWIDGLCRALLEGRPDVRRLLADDPFGDQPPQLV